MGQTQMGSSVWSHGLGGLVQREKCSKIVCFLSKRKSVGCQSERCNLIVVIYFTNPKKSAVYVMRFLPQPDLDGKDIKIKTSN